jgi:hypothetical protein
MWALEGRWSGLAPVLRVRDLQLGEGAAALRLDDVKLVPDPGPASRRAKCAWRASSSVACS